MQSPPPRSASSTTRDAALLACAALGLFAILAQDTFYKVDGQVLLWLARNDAEPAIRYSFYLPALDGLHSLLAPLGCSLFEAARWMSALGTAIGLFFGHLALAGLLADPRAARNGTLLILACPGILFFATVVEVHGLFLAFAGLSMWTLTRHARDPSWRRGATWGIATGLAALSHPTGALLLALMPPVFWLAQPEGTTALLRRSLRHGALPATLCLILFWSNPTAGDSGSFLTQFAGGSLLEPTTWLAKLGQEALLPLFPVLLPAVFALGSRTLRGGACWLLLALLPYLAVCCLLLPGFDERGAYVLPFAWPAAALALRTLGDRWPIALSLCVAGLAAGSLEVMKHDRPDRAATFAAGIRDRFGSDPVVLLLADPQDAEAAFIHMEDDLLVSFNEFFPLPGQVESALAAFDARFARAPAGVPVLLPSRTWQRLESAVEHGYWPVSEEPVVLLHMPDAAALRDHLQRRYRMEEIRHIGFDGFRIHAVP